MSVYIFVFFVNDMPEQLFFSFVGHDTYKGVCGEKVVCVVSVATWRIVVGLPNGLPTPDLDH